MSIFSRHAAAAAASMTMSATPVAEVVVDPEVAVVPVVDAEPTPINDPLTVVDETDEFDAQRQARNAEMATEALSADLSQEAAPTAEDMTVGEVDTDRELPEGDHGEEVTITGPADNVVVDADPSDVEFDSQMDQFEAEATGIEGLVQELTQLTEAGVAIERFGFNPTAAAIMQTTGLLNSTALESLALESITFSNGASDESTMALEALSEKIKDKASAFAAKILHVAQSGSEKIIGVIDPLWNKITDTVGKIGDAAWDKTKAAGATIKAHPYQSAAAAVAAIAAVAGVVALVTTGTPAPGAKVDVVRSFLGNVAQHINKIKFPGGAIKATVNKAGNRVMLEFAKTAFVVESGVSSALGWTQASAKVIAGQLGRNWDVAKKELTALGIRAGKLAGAGVKDIAVGTLAVGTVADAAATDTAAKVLGGSKVGKFASTMIGRQVGGAAMWAYLASIAGIVYTVFSLARFVIVGTFRMIAQTLRALVPHGNTAAA